MTCLGPGRDRFSVVYDACVLYPAPRRDLLMRLALTDLYRALCSDHSQEEWMTAVLRNRPGLSTAQLERTRPLMKAHVREARRDGHQPLIPALQLPDPDDLQAAAPGQPHEAAQDNRLPGKGCSPVRRSA